MKIDFSDVTLREGAQVEDGVMNRNDQIGYVNLLIEGGVNIIEAGYPGSSNEQFSETKRIVDHVHSFSGKRPFVSGLAMASIPFIDAVKRSGCDVCHIYLPTSNELMLAQFNKDKYGDSPEGKRDWAIEHAANMVAYAHGLGFTHVQFSPEDAARTDKKYLCQMIREIIKAGADRINIPDTTGLRILNEFGDLIDYVLTEIPEIKEKGIKISVHCHNDSDHSAANAIQAIYVGMKHGVAIDVEGTFFGLGERSGMTKFESVVMILNTRRDIFGDIEIGFNIELCDEAVNFVANALGMQVPRHWPVVGVQNRLVNSGTHQAIEAKAKAAGSVSPYYSWNPSLYTRGKKVEIIINRSSGKEGLKSKLKELGFQIEGESLEKVYQRAMALSDSRGGEALNDMDLISITQEETMAIPFPITIKKSQVIGGKGTMPTTSIEIEMLGKTALKSATARGTFGSIMIAVKGAVDKIIPQFKNVRIEFDGFNLTALGSGINVPGDSFIRLKIANGKEGVFSGRAIDPDTIQSVAQSFANCMSWVINAHADEWSLTN